MYHTHFNSIHSTQLYLRDNLTELKKKSSDILVSASEQTLGIGRKGNQWDSYQHSLAMSFTLRPNSIPTLTPIEIGILFTRFVKFEFGISLFLKWPNDLLTAEGKKCGGIIAQYIDSDTVVAGVGINLGSLDGKEVPAHYKHGLGNVSETLKLSDDDKKNIPARAYEFLINHRLEGSFDIQKDFKDVCIHIGKKVSIDDDGEFFEGLFMGIGKNGEALVEIEGHLQSFLSSSLKILN